MSSEAEMTNICTDDFVSTSDSAVSSVNEIDQNPIESDVLNCVYIFGPYIKYDRNFELNSECKMTSTA